MPEDNGHYTCDICGQSIHVGDGGNKNFLQHCGLQGCLQAARKATVSKASTANTNKITSFFSKAKGGDPKPTVSMTGFVARAPFSPPLLPHSSLNPLDQAGNKMAQSASNQQSAHPDVLAIALLDRLDLAIQDLPLHVPEAEDKDEMAQVVLGGGPNDPADTWEFLDCRLNGLLGYGVSVNKVARLMRHRPLGVKGLAGYIQGFVIDYSIAGVLLEGKIGVLLKAISLIKQCIVT